VRIEDCRIIVTGAASGLGRAFALGLCADGAKVAAIDVDREGLEALAAEARRRGVGPLFTCAADVSREEDVVRGVRAAWEDCGPINGLINNAGIYRDGVLVKTFEGSVIKMPLAQWRAVLDVDLDGVFLMTREVAARIVAGGVRPGLIINISSVSRHGNPGQGNYSAAKAGVVTATRAWAEELAPHGIRVAAIAPGFVETPILRAMPPDVLGDWIARVPLRRLGRPDEIFAGVRFIIGCDYFNGKCLDIDGGLGISP